MPLLLVEARSFPLALEAAAARRALLPYADLKSIVAPGAFLAALELRGADLGHALLSGADLTGADLRTARLVRTYLQDADLSGADLRHADLRGADLRGARLDGAHLVGADLRGALFYGASLDGTVLDWRWAGMPGELLRRADRAAGRPAGPEVDPVGDAERPVAWLKAILADRESTDRAIAALGPFIRAGDNSPAILRALALDVAPATSAPAPPQAPTSPMLWTSRPRPRPGARRTARAR
ncbi:Serine/threonine-protein kinase B [Aquisphaera giovannonii]|uniref:Serine/threonine-protein kinase B n=1 Tax=Aquisphaera giovannonii TaxID=406548 RepID=A0A5B9WDU6_9BACT|nr:pentapeptide repeat-containing protein [Aquisphaera giovannonii]QEH38633.1 Serine/threonine-protein kinase B [Aquisphaera giovannonii]